MSDQATIEKGKTPAIISYFAVIGLIIALVMDKEKNSFTRFHIRQSIGIMVLYFIVYIIMMVLIIVIPKSASFASLLFIPVIVLWIMGFVSAIQGKEKTVPVVGDKFQDLLKSI